MRKFRISMDLTKGEARKIALALRFAYVMKGNTGKCAQDELDLILAVESAFREVSKMKD